MLPFWWEHLRVQFRSPSGRSRAARFPARQRRARPALEVLEDRLVLAQPGSLVTTLAASGSDTSIGFTPNQIRKAYGIDLITLGGPMSDDPYQLAPLRDKDGQSYIPASPVVGDGTGQTIAIVAPYDNPNLVNTGSPNFSTSDLARFDAAFALPDPPSFIKINQNGDPNNLPPTDPGGPGPSSAAFQEAMQIEWVHAVAPKASIVLVECDIVGSGQSYLETMQTGVKTAASFPGVSVVVLGWTLDSELANETDYEHVYTTPAGHQGVTFVGAVGNTGPATVAMPSALANVLAVGSTTLTLNPDNSYASESAWSGSAGGISQYELQPPYQGSVRKLDSGYRSVPDVSIVGNPATGVAVYDSYDFGGNTPWITAGGTALSSALWSGLVAIANQGRALDGHDSLDGPSQTLPAVYTLNMAGDFNQSMVGQFNSSWNYDLTFGLGSPMARRLVSELAGIGFLPTVGVNEQVPITTLRSPPGTDAVGGGIGGMDVGGTGLIKISTNAWTFTFKHDRVGPSIVYLHFPDWQEGPKTTFGFVRWSLLTNPIVPFTPSSLPTGLVGNPYNQTITVGDNTTSLVDSVTSTTKPADLGLALNLVGNQVIITGTPSQAGSFTFDVTATTGEGYRYSQTHSYTVLIQEPPTITSPANISFAEGLANSFAVTVTGFPTPRLTEQGKLPAGVTFLAATGVLSGTPVGGTAGIYPITFTASNGVDPDDEQSFTLSIVPSVAPSITSANSTTFSVGASGAFQVTAKGLPVPIMNEFGALPDGVAFDSATGLLSGTPKLGSGGSYPINFVASNGVGADASQSFTLNVTEAPAITSSASATFTVGQAGSFTFTSRGFPKPTFTLNGTLPDGITFNPVNATLTGAPRPGTSGLFNLTLTASNSVGPDVNQDFKLAVNQAPAITSASAATFVTGIPGTFTVIAIGYPAPILILTGILPNGLTFDAGTGILSGTAAANVQGTFNLTFTATNGVLPTSKQNFALTVTQGPAITSASTATFLVGTLASFSVTVSNMAGASLSETGNLPAGVSFNAGTKSLQGTPAPGTGGNYEITFTASNSAGVTIGQAFTLTVAESPKLTGPASGAFTVGRNGSLAVNATGFPAPALHVSGTLPDGLILNDLTGVLSGMAGAGSGGTYNITIIASNGFGADASLPISLVVNEPASFTSENSTIFSVGTAGAFKITSAGFPAPTLKMLGTLPTGVGLNLDTGALAGTPAPGSAGDYTLTLTASSSAGGDARQIFTLHVYQPPAITNVTSTGFAVGKPGSLTLKATGTPKPTFAVSGKLPQGLTFDPNAGVLSGIPAMRAAGTYPLVFTAVNGAATSATQNVTLIVNQSPAFSSPPTATFTLGTASSFTVTAAGFPAPTLRIIKGSLPAGVTFKAATNTLSGVPQGAAGIYQVTILASNGVDPAATQVFTLVIRKPPVITSLAGATFAVGSQGKFKVTATGFPLPSYGIEGKLPSGLTFDPASGTLAGVPAPGTGGTYRLTFTAQNGPGKNAAQAFSLVINEKPQITSADHVTFFLGAMGQFNVTVAGFPAVRLTVSGKLPAGITLNPVTGFLSGKPAANVTPGNYKLVITAKNTVGAAATQAFTLTIVAPSLVGNAIRYEI